MATPSSNPLELILVHNHKGGTGKTTLAVHLAFAMTGHGQRWAFWDADAQHNAVSWLTGHTWQGEEAIQLRSPENGGAELMVATGFHPLSNEPHLLVDTPPSESVLDRVGQHVSMNARDLVVCPVSGRLSIDGAIKVAEEVAPTGCRVVLVPNLTDPKDGHAKEEIRAIKDLAQAKEVNAEVFPMAIPRNDKYMREAELQGKPVWNLPHARRTHTAKALRAFCDWVARGAPKGDHGLGTGSSGSAPSVSKKLKRRLWT